MGFLQFHRDIDLLGAFFHAYAAFCANGPVAIGIILVDLIRVANQFSVAAAGLKPSDTALLQRQGIQDSKILGNIHPMRTGHAVLAGSAGH